MARILVIEDNETNLKLVRFLLEQASHEVCQADDAEVGIHMANTRMPDLILMDVQLPGIDGLTATRRLRADPRTRHMKIIALTALAMQGDREMILEAGCDAYVAKPISYKEFLHTVETVLAK